MNTNGVDASFSWAILAALAQCCRSVIKDTKDLRLRTSLERLTNDLLRHHIHLGLVTV